MIAKLSSVKEEFISIRAGSGSIKAELISFRTEFSSRRAAFR